LSPSFLVVAVAASFCIVASAPRSIYSSTSIHLILHFHLVILVLLLAAVDMRYVLFRGWDGHATRYTWQHVRNWRWIRMILSWHTTGVSSCITSSILPSRRWSCCGCSSDVSPASHPSQRGGAHRLTGESRFGRVQTSFRGIL